MSAQKATRFVAIAVVASVAALIPAPPIGAASVSASARKGNFLVTKECSTYDFTAGSFCTITSSSLSEILVGSKVFYDQPANIPTGLLDSNVVLDAGDGDRAVGRCTLDLSTLLGLCTFSDGTGRFSGFQARVEVSYLGTNSDFAWDGTYSFTPQAGR
jgi:hypothetical protein